MNVVVSFLHTPEGRGRRNSSYGGGSPFNYTAPFALLYLFRDHTLEQKRRRKNETSSLVFFFPHQNGILATL